MLRQAFAGSSSRLRPALVSAVLLATVALADLVVLNWSPRHQNLVELQSQTEFIENHQREFIEKHQREFLENQMKVEQAYQQAMLEKRRTKDKELQRIEELVDSLKAGGISTSDTLPEFPWPPPRPSSRQEIARQVIMRGGAEASLRAVADELEAALRSAEYEYSFYGVPGGGFALVARLERIEENGTATAGDRRFLPPDAREPFDLASYVSALFFAPAGYYRMIAFVVTDRPITSDENLLDGAAARRMPAGGASALPDSFATTPFGPDYRVYALVYEFRKLRDDGEVTAQVPGRLTALAHLKRSGLEPALEKRR